MTPAKSPDRMPHPARRPARRPGRRLARRLSAAMLRALPLLALALLPGTAATAAEQRLEAVPCPFEVPFGESAQCGYLVAPQDHARPDGETVRVFFAILRAHAATAAPDPIVQLAGGPGQAMSDFVDGSWYSTLADRAHRDVILFDQRGTGRSEPLLDCAGIDPDAFDANPANDSGVASDADKLRAALAACRQGYEDRGIDLHYFDTEQSALDLKLLREGLRIQAWNLVGTSYGTRLALEAARLDPDGIRSLVLNSTMTMGDAFEPQIFDDRIRILDRLFADCAANGDCAAAFPTLAESFEALRERLSETPLQVSVVEPEGGEVIEFEMDFPTFVGILMTHLSFQPSVEMVPLFIDSIDAVTAGRRTLTDAQWARILGPSLFQGGGMAVGLHLSVLCREVLPIADLAAVDRRAGDSRGMFSPRDKALYAEQCEVWGAGEARESFSEPVASDIPTLLLIGEYDPLTPPYWTAMAAQHLSNSRAIAFPGAAHDVLGTSLCARTIVTAFLRDIAAELDTACVEGQTPRFFVPPSKAAAATGAGAGDGQQ